MSKQFLGYSIGDESKCAGCGEAIVFTGKFWEHADTSPRHPALPHVDYQQIARAGRNLNRDLVMQRDHLIAIIAMFSDKIDAEGLADWDVWNYDMMAAGWEFSAGHWRKGGAIVPPSKMARWCYDGHIPTEGNFK